MSMLPYRARDALRFPIFVCPVIELLYCIGPTELLCCIGPTDLRRRCTTSSMRVVYIRNLFWDTCTKRLAICKAFTRGYSSAFPSRIKVDQMLTLMYVNELTLSTRSCFSIALDFPDNIPRGAAPCYAILRYVSSAAVSCCLILS
jgi:hypothetical protein